MRSEIRVLLVDDHSLVRAGIRRILSDVKHITLVGEAESGQEAVSLALKLKPQVILMDLKMPGMDGLEASRQILAANPQIHILIISVCLDEVLLPRLFQEGVQGFFSKNTGAAELIKAIEQVFDGERYISPLFARQLGIKNLDTRAFFAFDELSERELQVILLIIEGETMQDISERLAINRKTINSYRTRSFHKLNVKNDVELTLLAARQGLLKKPTLLSEPEPEI